MTYTLSSVEAIEATNDSNAKCQILVQFVDYQSQTDLVDKESCLNKNISFTNEDQVQVAFKLAVRSYEPTMDHDLAAFARAFTLYMMGKRKSRFVENVEQDQESVCGYGLLALDDNLANQTKVVFESESNSCEIKLHLPYGYGMQLQFKMGTKAQNGENQYLPLIVQLFFSIKANKSSDN